MNKVRMVADTIHPLAEKIDEIHDAGMQSMNECRERIDRVVRKWLEEKVLGVMNCTFLSDITVRENQIRVMFELSQPKEWCEHISQEMDGIYWDCEHGEVGHHEKGCSTWDFCPICGAKRPT